MPWASVSFAKQRPMERPISICQFYLVSGSDPTSGAKASKEAFHWGTNRVLPKAQHSIQEQLLRRNVKRFRGGLVFEANRLWYHSALGRE